MLLYTRMKKIVKKYEELGIINVKLFYSVRRHEDHFGCDIDLMFDCVENKFRSD